MRSILANANPTRGTLVACMFIALGLATPLYDAYAATMGRLFFTPAQRAKLDQLRNTQPGAMPKSEADPTEQAVPEPAHAPQPVTLNGVVRRSDGSTTIWINEQMHPTGSHRSAKAADANGVDVVLPESKRKVRLKVGQTVDPSSGLVNESRGASETAPDLSSPSPRPAEPARLVPNR